MEERKYNLIKAPDGYYIGKIMKSGMLSKDSRRISDEEIMAMFEDVLRRNRAETGRSVMSVFSHGKPVMVAKLEPDIMECGVIERERPQRQQAVLEAKVRQQAMAKQAQQHRGLRLAVPK